jgi:MFS family permease
MNERTRVLALLVALSGLTYLDRVCIAIVGPRMQEDLQISPERWGWVLGAFVLAYGVFEIPSGALGDRFGQRTILTRIVVWWSAFTVLTGCVSNFFLLLVTRFLFGAGEAGAYPNIAGTVGRWFPPSERAGAQGLVWGASRIGAAVSPWLVVPIMATLGWRAVFWLCGPLGLAWAVVWTRTYRDPPAGSSELEGDVGRTNHLQTPWARLFRAPQLWLLMAMYWFYVWGAMFYLTWLPTYLVKGRGLAESEMGAYTAFPFLLGALANISGGFLTDRLTRDLGPSLGKRLIGSVSLLLSAVLMAVVAVTPGKAAAIVLLSLGFGAMDCMLPAAWAVCLDLGREHAGAVSGAMNTAGQAGGFVCSVLFGYLVQASGSYDLPLLLLAAMLFVSAFLFWLIDPTRPLVSDD